MPNNPVIAASLRDPIERRANLAASASHRMAADAAFLFKQSLAKFRPRDRLHRNVILRERLAGLAEHEERERLDLRIATLQRRHAGARHNLPRRLEMLGQPLGAAFGADLVQLGADVSTEPAEFMAADATLFVEHGAAAGQDIFPGQVRRGMTLGA